MPKRPEHLGPPELFYNDVEAIKYTNSSRIIDIQMRMCERAVELLLLPEGKSCLLLDIGCGSGLSGSVLEMKGHFWIGVDISPAMLTIGIQRKVKGDTTLVDMGQGIPFKTASFDGAISISALQWLCNISNNKQILSKRLHIFFSTLFASLSKFARAIFQFYPENDEQINIITKAATKAGFFGGVIIDYPNSNKAKKIFLVLMTNNYSISSGMTEKHQLTVNKSTKRKPNSKGNIMNLRKNWILKKKQKNLRKGKCIKFNSKYTGRKRKNMNTT